jgi:SNF2 family DNA or RNA helicase
LHSLLLLLSLLLTQVLVVDEAHRLKNDASRLTASLAQSSSKIKWKRCLLLTGTPLQNNTEELWTLLNFVDPAAFDDKARFSARFGDMSDSAQVCTTCSLDTAVFADAVHDCVTSCCV